MQDIIEQLRFYAENDFYHRSRRPFRRPFVLFGKRQPDKRRVDIGPGDSFEGTDRSVADAVLSPRVFGYFFGGGWAFGRIEDDDFRYQAESVSAYSNTPKPADGSGTPLPVTYRYGDPEGQEVGEVTLAPGEELPDKPDEGYIVIRVTVEIGTDLPYYEDLRPIDRAAVDHDLGLRAADEQFWRKEINAVVWQELYYEENQKLIIKLRDGNWDEENAALDARRDEFDTVDEYERAKSLLAYEEASAEAGAKGLENLNQTIEDAINDLRSAIESGVESAIEAATRKIQNIFDGPRRSSDLTLVAAVGDASEDSVLREEIERVASERGVSPELILERAYENAVDTIVSEFENLESGQIGALLGSQLGVALQIDNVFVDIASTSVLSALGRNIEEAFRANRFAGDIGLELDGQITKRVFDDFFEDTAEELIDGGIGAISSYLTAELVEALGLDGVGGQLLSTVGNSAIGTIVDNIRFNATAPADSTVGLFENVDGAIFSAAGSFVGSRLAEQIVGADTVAGQIGGSIGSSIGSFVSGQIIGSIGSSKIAGLLGNFIVPGIGSLIGAVLGTLIGDLFGKTPRSGADLEYSEASGEFQVGASYKKGKGSRETAELIAQDVGKTLNGIVDFIGGYIQNPHEIETGHYGTYKSKFRYQSERGSKQIEFDEIGNLVSFGTLVALEDLKIAGGDIHIKRALNQSLENQKQGPEILVGGVVETAYRPTSSLEIETLLGDLSTANDYSFYLENSTLINATIVNEPESAFAAGWLITIARAFELGLHRRDESDWYGGWELFLTGHEISAGNTTLYFDDEFSERVISIIDPQGNIIEYGDQVNPFDKDRIEGTSSADTIIVNGATVEAGLTINGEVTTETFEIDVAARIHGGDGNDTIWGGDRGNDIFGEGGDDQLYGGGTADWIFGGDGNDTLDAYVSDSGNYLDGGAGNDTLIGRGGSDWLDGGAGVDTLDGGDGNDFLRGGAGDGDVVRGGRGDDVYIYGESDGADQISDEGFAAASPDRPVETVTFSVRHGAQNYRRFDALSLGYLDVNWDPRAGSPGAADAAAASVTVQGKAQGGEDRLVFGEGVTIENIRVRRDVDGAGVADDLVIDILDTNGDLTGDTVRLSDWYDPFNRVEWLEFADGQSFRIGDFMVFSVGSDGDDVLFGSDSNDFIHGGAGHDIIHLLGGDDIGNGGLGDDFITGDAGRDIVIGGNDDDLVLGGSGDDVVSGDLGDDIVRGDAGDDLLTGGLGDDIVVGGAGNDTFKYNRGDGFDIILDAYSADGWDVVFDGAAGWVDGITFHNVDHDGDSATVHVDQVHYNGTVLYDGDEWHGAYQFNTTTNLLQWHAGDTVGDLGSADTLEFGIGIEIGDLVFQGSGDDLLVGINTITSDNAAFSSLADVIRLKGWETGIRGIERFSFFNSGTTDIDAFDQMVGGTDGNDSIAGGNGADWITGGAGADELNGGAGDDLLVGHGGSDNLLGGAGSDILLGGSGADILDGGTGADALIGGAGFDIASYASSDVGVQVTLENSTSVDRNPITDVFSSIEGLEGSNFADTLRGDKAGNDLIGGGGADQLEGDAGDDRYIIRAGDGADVILDRGVDVSGISQQVALNEFGAVGDGFTENFDQVDLRYVAGVPQYVYRWTLTHAASGTLAYSQEVTYFSQQSSAPTFFNINHWQNGFAQTGVGRGVSRTIGSASYYDGGDDAVFWETGESLSNLTFSMAGANLVIVGADASVTIEGFANVESRIEEFSLADGLAANLGAITFSGVGTSNADFLVGDAGANFLNGAEGDDILSGSGGNDILEGGTGDDVLEGGAGADILDGGDGLDAIRYTGSSVGVDVDLAAGTGAGGEAAGDNISGIEVVFGSTHNDNITGDLGDNRLFGDDGNDNLTGGGGADVLQGGAGDDQVFGGAGDDNIDGGEGDDTLSGGDGVDAILGGAGRDMLHGGAGVDFLSGESGDDHLEGGEENDTLSGGDGDDSLAGGAGDDVLIGGAGDDHLEGGAGDDVYEFSASSGADTIVDTDGLNQILITGATRENIRFDRIADDLVMRVIGDTGSLTLSGFYSATGTNVHTISAGDHVLYLDHALGFFDLYKNLPVGETSINQPISDELDRHWHLFGNARPEGADVAVATDEDVSVTGHVEFVDHDDNISSYALAGAPVHGSVIVDALTGAFIYTPDQDFFGQDVFYVNVEDESGNISDVLVTVDITPVNDAPEEVVFTGVSIIEENTADITLGDLNIVDVDGTPNEHTLSVNDARFEIIDNQLRLRPGQVFDFETDGDVTVELTATDSEGAVNLPSVVTFTIQDINEAPTIGDTAFNAAEDVAIGTIVGGLSAVDPDGGIFGDIRYYFQSSSGDVASVSDNGLFSIDEFSGEVTLVSGSLNYEATSTYDLTAIVRDSAGMGGYFEATAALAISVTNVNEAPDDIILTNAVVDENGDGAVVGIVSASDPDGPTGGVFSQHIFAVDDARFFVDGAGALRLKSGGTLDYETEPSITLTVTATDENGVGLSYVEDFTIDVNDVIDVLNGTSLQDVVNGAQGVDHIFGFDGDDIIAGNDGNDEIRGGGGDDNLRAGAGDDFVDGGEGNDAIYGADGHDVIYGREGADYVWGGTGNDIIYGGIEDTASNTLFGADGDDELHGGRGDDVLSGGAGADALFGEGGAFDVATYADAADAVVVDLTNSSNNTGDAVGDTYTDIDAFEGSAYNDAFTGGEADDYFIGGAGDDSLVGGGGADTLNGGDGADTLIGGAGHDVLYGGDGADILDAGDGNDRLDGGAGNDILIGGLDQDIYVIKRGDGADIIRNYDPSGAGDTISFADDINYDDLWFSRNGDDLVITVVGGDVETVVEDWYLSPMAGDPENAFKLELFLVDNRETISVDAEQLVQVMGQHLVDEGVSRPQSEEDLANALQFIGGTVDQLWGFSTPPTIEAVDDITIIEDGTLSFTARVYDDKVAAQLLTLGATSSDASIISPSDVVIGTSDDDGYRSVTITPQPDASGIVTVALQATDGGSGVTEEPFTVTVLAVADIPALAIFSASGNAGAPIALNIVASQTDVDLSETLTIELGGVPANATLSAGADLGGGVWRLMPDELSGLTVITGAGDANDFQLSVTAISTEGGTSEQVTLPLNVSVNGAPNDIDFSGAIDENAINGTLVGDASYMDPDSGGSHIYSLVNDAGGRFEIDGASGQVRVLNGALLDHEDSNSHTIRIRVVDQAGLAREESFAVSVNNINETPSDIYAAGGTAAFEDRSFAENLGNGSVIAQFETLEPDGDTVAYSLTDSAGGRFAINAVSGVLTIANSSAIDYETATSHIVSIQVQDQGGLSRTESFTINIADINEAPTDIWPAGGTSAFNARTIAENAANGSVVANFNHADPEGGTATYALTNNAGGRFAINATSGVVTVANTSAINYEAASAHGITVRVTDPGGLSRSENFTVNIGDVNEAPYITNISASTYSTEPSANVIHLSESKAYRDWDVAYLHSGDPEGQSRSYFFRHSNGSYSTVSQDGRLKIINNRVEVNSSHLNYESTPNTLSYQIAARDTGGLYSATRTMTLKVTDVNETPYVHNKTFNPAENWNPTVSIGRLSYGDPDSSSTANGQLKFTIWGGNTGNKFRIDHNGRIWLNSALNYETTSQRTFNLNIRIRDRNNTGLYDHASVRVNVQNVNEAPIVTAVRSIYDNDSTDGYAGLNADIDAYDPDGSAISYIRHSASGFSLSSVQTNSSGQVWLTRSGFSSYGSATIRIRDAQNQSVYRTVNLNYERVSNGGNSPWFPVVLDLDGDGVELLEVSESGVSFDYDADGVNEETGWVGADDGLLAIDRNGDGIINDGSEIAYVDDLEGATTDLEGLVAFDTNGNNAIDAGDDAWLSFRVWNDANLNGISEASELQTLDEAGIEAISLTRTLTGDEYETGSNLVSATSEFFWQDGSIGDVADVAFYYLEPADGDVVAPIVLDLGGDGLNINAVNASNALFDMDGDGVRDATAWVGPDDGLLVFDRNGNGTIDDFREISFVEDLEGATSDLEGLRAFDTDGDNLFDSDDELFSSFQVWRDVNQDGISSVDELSTLEGAGILWIDLAITSTGAEQDNSSDFVVTGISNFVTTEGDIRVVGDASFRFVSSRDNDPTAEQNQAGELSANNSMNTESIADIDAPIENSNTGEGQIDARRDNADVANEPISTVNTVAPFYIGETLQQFVDVVMSDQEATEIWESADGSIYWRDKKNRVVSRSVDEMAHRPSLGPGEDEVLNVGGYLNEFDVRADSTMPRTEEALSEYTEVSLAPLIQAMSTFDANKQSESLGSSYLKSLNSMENLSVFGVAP